MSDEIAFDRNICGCVKSETDGLCNEEGVTLNMNVGGLVHRETPAEAVMDRAVDYGTVGTDGALESDGSSFGEMLGGVVNFNILKNG